GGAAGVLGLGEPARRRSGGAAAPVPGVHRGEPLDPLPAQRPDLVRDGVRLPGLACSRWDVVPAAARLARSGHRHYRSFATPAAALCPRHLHTPTGMVTG